jgi:transposase InsO family protein
MSDNGSAYVAAANRRALAELGIRHLRIEPYRPRTNGKAERFIQTLLNERAYQRIHGSSGERANALPLFFLDRYNFRRPHGSLGHRPPVSRLTNVVGNYG